jgi:hypothetical protein
MQRRGLLVRKTMQSQRRSGEARHPARYYTYMSHYPTRYLAHVLRMDQLRLVPAMFIIRWIPRGFLHNL